MGSSRFAALLMLALVILPSTVMVSGSSLIVLDGVEAANARAEAPQLNATLIAASVLDNRSETAVERLVEHVNDVMERLEEAFERLGDEVPEAAGDSYDLGVDDLEAAIALLEDGNYTGASSTAREAFRHFSEAFKAIRELMAEEEPSEEEEDAKERLGLRVAIERAYVYLDRVNETLQRLSDEMEDISAIEELLEEARMHLDYAMGNFTSGDHDVSVREFAEARRLLGSANALLQRSILEHKKAKAAQYMEHVRAQIRNLNGTLHRLQEQLEEGELTRVRAVLNATASHLQRLQERLREYGVGEDIDEALDELEDAVDEIENSLDDLIEGGIGSQLRSINRVQAWIQVMNSTRDRLYRRGEDASGIQEKMQERIQDAERIMEEAKESLGRRNAEELRELLEEAREHFEGAREEMQSAMSDWKEDLLDRLRERFKRPGGD
jgi:tetratricopeptide (TPR) repeat protein